MLAADSSDADPQPSLIEPRDFHLAHSRQDEFNLHELRHNFALAMGFASYQELLEASVPVPSNDGRRWYLSALPDQRWGAWNDDQPIFDRHFASREEALESVPHEAHCSGSAMLG